MLLSVLLIIILALCAYHYFGRGLRVIKYMDKIPGPPEWPVIGSLLSYLVPYDRLWYVVRKMNDDYYPLYKAWSLHFGAVNIRHPDDIEILLQSMQHVEKSLIYKFLHPWFGTGLLTSTGEKWQHRRKILTPAFHFNVLQKYANIIVENSDRMVENLKSQGESVQSLLPLVTNYTLNVICEAAMGTSLEDKKESQKEYRDAIHEMGDILPYRLQRPWVFPDWIFNLTPKGRQQREVLKLLHGFSTRIIKERIEYHEKTEGKFLKMFNLDGSDNDKADEEVFGIRKRRLAMLDLLIAAYRDGKQIDLAGIREEVDTFMFEGHDTSAMGLCFALLLLAEHKDIQERARAEVTKVLVESGGKMNYSEIQRFHFLERCIKESLRLYPSVPFISRAIPKDLQLKNYLIPKGALVHLHIFDVHRDPNFWPDPEKFDPDRFLHEKIQHRHPYSYIPFSAGPRNCIGQKFAMLELKAVIAHLLYDFYLEPVDLAAEVPIVCDLVLRPGRPIHLKLVPIQK